MKKNSEFDFKMAVREHGRCDMILECEDEESLTGRGTFLTEPLRSRTASFTVPNCSSVQEVRQSRSTKEKKRTNVIVTSSCCLGHCYLSCVSSYREYIW